MLSLSRLSWNLRLRSIFSHIGRDSIIYPAAERIRSFALSTAAGFLGLLIYHYRAASPLSILLMAALALPMLLVLLWRSWQHPYGRFPYIGFYSFVIWYCFVMSNTWIYIADGYGHFSLLALLITSSTYYLMAEWWHVLLGSLLAIVCCFVLTKLLALPPNYPPEGDWVLLITAHICWMGFSLSNRSKREDRLRDTQALLRQIQRHLQPSLQNLEGVMPELRYALKEAALSVQDDAQSQTDIEGLRRIREIGQRLQNSTESMEDYLDLQCVNVRYLALEGRLQLLSAEQLLRFVVDNYPYTNENYKKAVQFNIQEDFHFLGVREQWEFALRNVFQNALIAVFALQQQPCFGDVQISIAVRGERGLIRIQDKGVGVDAVTQHHAFEPFYSKGEFAGLGLGLSYCRAVVEGAGGDISLRPRQPRGASVQMSLPVMRG